MKHLVKYILPFATISILLSCNIGLSYEVPAKTEDFIIVSAESMSASTRTSLYDRATYWSAGDTISVFDSTGKRADYVFKKLLGEGGKASFVRCSTDEGFQLSDLVVAYYPGTKVSSYNSGKLTVNIPGTQKYVDGTFALHSAPMACLQTTEVSDTTTLYFQNLFGVVKMPIFTELTASVKSISLTSGNSNYKLSGDYAFIVSDSSISFDSTTRGSSASVELKFETSKALGTSASPSDFYVVLPPAASLDLDDDAPVTITITFSDDSTENYLMVLSKDNNGLAVLQQNTLLTMPRRKVVGTIKGSLGTFEVSSGITSW